MTEQVLYDLLVDEGVSVPGLGVTGRRIFYLNEKISARIKEVAKTHEISLLDAARAVVKDAKSPNGNRWFITRISPHEEPDYSPPVNEVKFFDK